MKPETIKKKLKEHKVYQKDIAARLGISEMTVSKVVRKRDVSDRIMRAVSEAIGEDYRRVFPEYYNSPAKRSTSKVSPV
ncbi:MAG TPA: helix-turn-helix transcriptional regulator [Acidobacteriota bacterium]|nr:helix-turn-helix transcriptional regulator [Acidobacteriota bacterium]